MKYAFVNGVILDGSKDMQPVTGKAVLTDGDRIVGITSELKELQGYEIVDLKGAYMLPGLIDSAAMISFSSIPDASALLALRISRGDSSRYLSIVSILPSIEQE